MLPLRIGVIGAAGRGSSFFSVLKAHPQVKLSALCDVREDALADAARLAEVGLTYTDHIQMLDDGMVDAVIVGTPMHYHAPMCIDALERGIHVLSEVPAAVSIEESKRLVAAAESGKGFYMMAENYCYILENVLVNEIAKAGLFGEMYFAEGEYIHELKELNEVTPWRRKWQTGINGCTYPTHSLGPALQWMDQRVVSVICFGTGHHYTDPRGDNYQNEDSTFVACRLSGGGLVNIRLDMLSNRPHNLTYYSLQGTDGCYESARGFGDSPKIWLKSRSEEMKWSGLLDLTDEFLPERFKNPPKEALDAGHGGGDYWVIEDFVGAIAKGEAPPIGIHEAMDMTLPGLVSQLSIEQGSVWMDVPDSRDWVNGAAND